MTETTRRENVLDPLLNILDCNIETGGNNTALVDATNQFNNDLSRAVVIEDLEFTNISCVYIDQGDELLGYFTLHPSLVSVISRTILLHDLKELNNYFGRGSQ
jgi:hypothetical protein